VPKNQITNSKKVELHYHTQADSYPNAMQQVMLRDLAPVQKCLKPSKWQHIRFFGRYLQPASSPTLFH